MTNIDISTRLLSHELGQLIQSGHRVILPVKGKSMLPFLKENRDKVVLEKADEIKVGDIVLAQLNNGSMVLHRIFSLKNGGIVLMGDGNVYGQELCTHKNIVAKVVAIQRKQKEINCTDLKARRKALLWKQLLPIRRYLLFIYRHTIL